MRPRDLGLLLQASKGDTLAGVGLAARAPAERGLRPASALEAQPSAHSVPCDLGKQQPISASVPSSVKQEEVRGAGKRLGTQGLRLGLLIPTPGLGLAPCSPCSLPPGRRDP